MEDLIDISVGLGELGNQAEVAIYMRNEILQSLIDLALGIAALDLDVFSVHIELSIRDGLLQVIGSGQFILSSLVLLITDDVLHGLWQLRHVALLHIFADLHGAL